MPEPALVDYRRMARQRLAAKQPVHDVEQALIDAGLDAATATNLVDRLLTESLVISAPLPQASPRGRLIVLGLILVTGGFYLAYFMYKADVMKGKVGPVDPLTVPGAGIALVGAKIVRTELMKLLG